MTIVIGFPKIFIFAFKSEIVTFKISYFCKVYIFNYA
jgi:hypothetical protein